MSAIIKRALLIGINYKGSECELGGCINDSLSIKDLLISHYEYKEENILLLTDDTNIKPTATNIMEGWKWLLSKSPSSYFTESNTISDRRYLELTLHDTPTFFFQYSGHGSRVKDKNGDEVDGMDETICPIDFEVAGMITDDVIRDYLAVKVPSNGKLFSIIDACHSESSLDLLWTAKVGFFGSFNLNKTGRYPPTAGNVTMLSGCKDTETSADIVVSGKGRGALTYAFLEVLKKNNYKITYDQLLIGVRKFIKKRDLSSQVPCISFGKSANISSKFYI